jgi:hypothetical protein
MLVRKSKHIVLIIVKIIVVHEHFFLQVFFKFYIFYQEHVVGMVVKLLSASLPSDSSILTPGSMNHYLAQMSTLNEILLGVSYGDAIHILSLYGMVRKNEL